MTAPRRILVLHHVAAISGAEKGLVDVARALRGAGWDVHVGIPDSGALPDRLRAEGFPLHPMPFGRVHRPATPFAALRLAARIVCVTVHLVRHNRYRPVHAVHCNSDTAMLLAAPAAWLLRKPCVWHRRDIVPLGAIGRLLGRRATRVIAISRTVADATAPLLSQPDKLVTLYNAIDVAELDASRRRSPEAVRDELGIDGADYIVATVGQLIPWKRQDLFLQMAARVAETVPHARFLIMGADMFNDHTDYVSHLRRQAESGPCAGRVVFSGYRHDVADVLGACDAVVHPATREPFGRALAEAMALGKPVVAMHACGPAEIIDDGISGRLVSAADDGTGLAEAVVALARDPAAAQRMGAAARRRIREHFSIDAFRSGLASLYTEPPFGENAS